MKAPYSRTLYDLLCEQAERYPRNEAVVSGTTRYTYPQLRDRAAIVAGGLRALGLKRNDRVGLLLNNSAGPDNRGLTIVMYLYQTGFLTGDLGYASAIGWILGLILAIAALIQLRWTRTEES